MMLSTEEATPGPASIETTSHRLNSFLIFEEDPRPNVLQALPKLINGQKKSRDLFLTQSNTFLIPHLLFLRNLLQVENLLGISFVNHFLRLFLRLRLFHFLPVKLLEVDHAGHDTLRASLSIAYEEAI